MDSVEAFDQVTTVVVYRDVPDAIQLAAMGGSSPAGSLVSQDPDVVREGAAWRGVAPYHGRLLVLNGGDAKSSSGRGSPTPMLWSRPPAASCCRSWPWRRGLGWTSSTTSTKRWGEMPDADAWITAIRLAPVVTVRGDVSDDRLQHWTELGHREWYIASSLRTDI